MTSSYVREATDAPWCICTFKGFESCRCRPDLAKKDRHEQRGGCTKCWRGLYIGQICTFCGALEWPLVRRNPLPGTGRHAPVSGGSQPSTQAGREGEFRRTPGRPKIHHRRGDKDRAYRARKAR